jgi:hypothetical protein
VRPPRPLTPFRQSVTLPPAGGPPVVLRMDPADGVSGVFRDSPVIISVSETVDPRSLAASTFLVEEAGGGEVPGTLLLSPDGTVLIWTAARLLRPAALHFVTVGGIRDRHGREIATRRSQFTACDLPLWDVPD